MKTKTFKLLALLILVTLYNCNNAASIDYKFSENAKALACEFPNSALLEEAIHSFENDILNHYDAKNKKASKAYASFINFNNRSNFNVKEVASAHSLKIAHAIKGEINLWANTNGTITLDRSGSMVNCISKNIKDPAIKTTFNALLATNSLRPKVILPPLASVARKMEQDGSLKAFLAFEFFYSKLLDVKLEDLKNPNPKEPTQPVKPSVKGVDLNKTPSLNPAKKVEKTQEPHAGHTH